MTAAQQQSFPADEAISTSRPRPFAEPTDLKQPPYPKWMSKVVLELARVHTKRWDWALEDLEIEQRKQLRRILDRAKGTEIGRKYRFDDMQTYEEFRSRVPIGDYDAHAPFIDRMRKGERNVLVPDVVRYFGNSSGSSNQGRSKFLPVTDIQIRLQRKAGQDALFRFLVHKNRTDFLDGYTLGLFPSTKMKEEGPVLVSSNPAIMAAKMPLFTRWGYLPDAETRAISDYDAKMTRIAENTLDVDIRCIAGTTCWFSVLFQRVLEVARRKGRTFAGRSVETVREIWPNLDLLMGGGVSADPYLPVIRTLLGRDDVTLVDTYNATEGGIYASSDFTGEPGMRVIPHRGTFFELVALEDHGKPNPRRVPMWEAEIGKSYVILPTTISGLYAYELGDIVRFTTKSPLRMEFVGRLSGCLSLTQELMTHVEVERAVASAIEKIGTTLVDFGAAGIVHEHAPPMYMIFAEPTGPVDEMRLIKALDEGLCEQNRVYREHRQGSVAIGAPRLVVLPPGTAARFLKGSTGGNVQGKFPRILNRTRAETLWSMVQPGAPAPAFA
jgi:hypothetical protein